MDTITRAEYIKGKMHHLIKDLYTNLPTWIDVEELVEEQLSQALHTLEIANDENYTEDFSVIHMKDAADMDQTEPTFHSSLAKPRKLTTEEKLRMSLSDIIRITTGKLDTGKPHQFYDEDSDHPPPRWWINMSKGDKEKFLDDYMYACMSDEQKLDLLNQELDDYMKSSD